MQTLTHFYVLAASIGLVQGGIQSLSRSYFAALVPAGKQGEFFGFYNMMGKFAAVLGPFLVGITALADRQLAGRHAVDRRPVRRRRMAAFALAPGTRGRQGLNPPTMPRSSLRSVAEGSGR